MLAGLGWAKETRFMCDSVDWGEGGTMEPHTWERNG